MSNRQSMTTSTTLDLINQHINREQFRTCRLWKYINGMFFTELDGKLVTESLFNQMYPAFIPETFQVKREDVDKTHVK